MNTLKITSLAAVAVFALSASAAKKEAAPKAGGAHASTPELVAKGKASYATNCLMCHGEKGDGNGPAGAVMNPKPRNFATDKFKQGDKAEQVFKTISEGVKGTAMAGFGHLSEDDRWALTHYVLTFRKK